MATSRFTCITCRVAFADPDLQRAHYKTDWHRYNLKRKVAELPPVTAENFNERVIAQRAANSASSEVKHEVCQICKKHFTSENSYQSHLRSRKHREREAMVEKRKDEEGVVVKGEDEKRESELIASKNIKNSVESGHHQEDKEVSGEQVDSNLKKEEELVESDDEPEPLEITECLFCPHMSKDFEASLHHMSKSHGFFFPDLEYLVDIKGLLSYLCEKVGVGYTCLYCNERGKIFYSVESVQQHMVDKSHCKLFFEGDSALEYAEYYDYTKSYPESSDKQAEGGESKALALPDSSLDVTDDLELVLPSGTKVGHRAMKHLYKQRLPTMEQRKSALIGRLMSQYRALGWKGYGGGESGELRQRDEGWARRMRQAKECKLGTKANKFQKHFRPQVVF